MEMLQEMTDDERLALRLRYKRDPLFCQWLPVLGMLARAGSGGEVEIWHEAERMLERLRMEPEGREAEVQFIYTDLCARHRAVSVRALAVMAVLLTCLADAAPAADRPDENPHAAVCVAILAMLDGDRRFGALLDAFFSRTRNNRGERVVLPVRDYLREGADGVAAEAFSGGRMVVGEERALSVVMNGEEALAVGKGMPSEAMAGEEKPAAGGGLLEQLVEQALRRDDAGSLRALKLRLYDLRQPETTAPLVARIDRRLCALTEPQPATQNYFNAGSVQFNGSTLNSPVLGALPSETPGGMLSSGTSGEALD